MIRYGILTVLCLCCASSLAFARTLAADGIVFTSYLYETGLFDRA